MKNSYLIILCFLIFSGCTNINNENQAEQFICNFYGDNNFDSNVIQNINDHSFASEKEAINVVEEILNLSGLERNFIVKEDSRVENAAAIVHENERYILYNKDFIKTVKNITKSEWASTSIIAHEVGHHLQGHTLKITGSRPNLELEADKFSGFIMYSMGASLADAQLAVRKITSENGSTTHPPRKLRLKAIQDGFNKAANQFQLRNEKKMSSETHAKTLEESKQSQNKTKPIQSININPNPLNDLSLKLLSKYNRKGKSDNEILSDFYLSGMNKPNGFMYRLRKSVPNQLPPFIPLSKNNKELFIADRSEDNWFCFYRSPLKNDAYFFEAVLFTKNGNIKWNLNLNDFIDYEYSTEIQDIKYDNELIYFNAACKSYSMESEGKCSKLICLDPDLKKVVWETDDLTSNDIIIMNESIIVCSYGFTKEKAYLFLINKHNGKIIDKVRMSPKPEYLELKENSLFVVDYNFFVHKFLIE